MADLQKRVNELSDYTQLSPGDSGYIAPENIYCVVDISTWSESKKVTLASLVGATITKAQIDALGVDAATLDGESPSFYAADSLVVKKADTSTADFDFVIDEDNMASDSNTKVPTQQSVKAYVDAYVTSPTIWKGGYDANTNTPDLDTTPISTAIGDAYMVTADGTFFSTPVVVGNILVADAVNATTEGEWTIVPVNLDAATIKTLYESNSDTNPFTDTEKSNLALAVLETDYNSNTMMLATSDDTPVASTAAQIRTFLNVADGAAATPSASTIKTLYEVNSDTNAYTDAEKAIVASAITSVTKAMIDALGVDAATLGGTPKSGFVLTTTDQTIAGVKTFTGNDIFTGYPRFVGEGASFERGDGDSEVSFYDIYVNHTAHLHSNVSMPGLPTYSDNAEAQSGGLVRGNLYSTPTGELRIVIEE